MGAPSARDESRGAPAASVVVPARDAAAHIGETLDGLARQSFDGPFEVIVVDDDSSDQTRELVSGHPVGARLLAGGGNGPGHARNVGVAASRGRMLAFIDSDCSPTRDWLRLGVRALEHADLVQGAVHATPGIAIGPFDRTLWVTRAWGLFESANLFVRRELFEALGGFESWLRPRSGELAEDAWFGWRARRYGARTAFCPDALVHHVVLRRSAWGQLSELRRRQHFPAIAARMPELRRELFCCRWFLSQRSAAFDAALLGIALACSRRRPAGLAAAVPYLGLLSRSARGWGRRTGTEVVLAGVAGDAVTAAALVYGSLRSRSLLL